MVSSCGRISILDHCTIFVVVVVVLPDEQVLRKIDRLSNLLIICQWLLALYSTDPRIGSIATTFVGSVSPIRDAIVGFLAMLLLEQPSRISLPEQEWLELLPDLLVSPMLTENVSWVNLTRDMEELDHSTFNSFTNMMVGEHCMPLVKLGMGQ